MNLSIFSSLLLLYFNIECLLTAPSEYNFYYGIPFDEEYQDVEKDVTFFVYTRTNPKHPERLYVGNKSALEQSAFDASKPTKFMSHGWNNNYRGPNVISVRKAFLAQGDYNVITVDWSNVSALPYMMACSRIKAVGGYIAKMIDFLVSQGSNPNDMSLVGHSLGAHVIGLAGYQAANKVGHVVGLDPAGPGFDGVGPGRGISQEDGQLVEIIHTNVDCMGIMEAAGHADFYVNGGGPLQPGTGNDRNCIHAHARAYEYYSESIKRPENWLARKCDTYRAFLKGDCSDNEMVSFPTWKNDGTKKRGNYYLRTNGHMPYGLGVEGTMPPST